MFYAVVSVSEVGGNTRPPPLKLADSTITLSALNLQCRGLLHVVLLFYNSRTTNNMKRQYAYSDTSRFREGAKRGRSSPYGGVVPLTHAQEMAQRRATHTYKNMPRGLGRGAAPIARAIQTSEIKYVDGYLDNTNLVDVSANDSTWAGAELNPRQATAVYGCLPVPQQGTNYADRDGRKIFLKKIHIKGILHKPQVNALTGANKLGFARLIVVKDKQTSGVALSAENVVGQGLGSDGNAALSADVAAMALTKPDGWGRYQILKDKIFVPKSPPSYQDGTDGAISGMDIPFKMTINVNEYVNFTASTGAIGSIQDCSIHLLGVQSEGAAFAQWTISYVARTSFVG